MTNDIFLHNTLTGKKEKFHSMKPGELGLYVCGITPYDETHLGHGRCYVVFDVLKRVFIKNGFRVKHIQNFTDIDDKIIERANKSGADPILYAQSFIDSFFDKMKRLNVLPANDYPRVTQSIPLIIRLIEKLIKRDFAYVLGGDVYYKVRQFKSYGQLSKRKIDELDAGSRVAVDEKKNDPLDFALWKAAKEGEPSWDSPWGQGRPGWHIECSAMSMDLLGNDFDIHGGGQDLIFPHHENEIAQSVGATGKGFAHTWVHNGFVTINEEKMSKSLGNFFTLKDLLSAYEPMAVRYFLLTQHYRSPLNYSDVELRAASSAWSQRICEAFRFSASAAVGNPDSALLENAQKLSDDFNESLNNDLNTPNALGLLNQLCSLIFKSGEAQSAFLHPIFSSMLNTLGLVVPDLEITDADALALLAKRNAARAAKDFATADQIRGELKSRGFVIEDSANGSRLKKLV